jgi:hypothetical protein
MPDRRFAEAFRVRGILVPRIRARGSREQQTSLEQLRKFHLYTSNSFEGERLRTLRNLAFRRKQGLHVLMTQGVDDTVLKLLMEAVVARRRTARAMLAAYAADALPDKAEDISYWETELADAEKEIFELAL